MDNRIKYRKLYEQLNREKIKEREKQYRLNNKEKLRKKALAYRNKNIDKINNYQKNWRKENVEHIKFYHIKKTYNLSKDEYNLLLLNQNNKCKLCKLKFKKDDKHCIDHCHKIGKIRGIIHRRCNSFIGLVNDNPLLLKLGIKYLEENK